MSRARAPRIDALTGLRILPALAVLLSHVGAPPWAGPHLSAFFDSGYAGVTVFFVLSGFVLTHNYFDRFVGQFSARLVVSYFAARLVRVYPLYLLVLVWVTFPALWQGPLNHELWLKHALGLQAWLGTLEDVYAFNGPGWSISVEFFLYVSFPLLVSLLLPVLSTPRRIGVALVFVVGLMAGVTLYFYLAGYAQLPWTDPRSAHRWLYRNPACRLGDFLLGMLAARLVACKLALPPRWIGRGMVLASAAIVALMCWPAHVWSAASWDISFALPGAALIFFLASAPPSSRSRWLASRPLVLLGEASYALYLCHVTALGRLESRSRKRQKAGSFRSVREGGSTGAIRCDLLVLAKEATCIGTCLSRWESESRRSRNGCSESVGSMCFFGRSGTSCSTKDSRKSSRQRTSGHVGPSRCRQPCWRW